MKRFFLLALLFALAFVPAQAADNLLDAEQIEELRQKGMKVEEYDDYYTIVFAKDRNIIYFTTKKNNEGYPFRVAVEFTEKDGEVVEKITPAYDEIKKGELRNKLKGFYKTIDARIPELKALLKRQIKK